MCREKRCIEQFECSENIFIFLYNNVKELIKSFGQNIRLRKDGERVDSAKSSSRPVVRLQPLGRPPPKTRWCGGGLQARLELNGSI